MKAYPQRPPGRRRVHGRHGHGSPVKNRWRFSKFCKKKNTKLWPSLWKSVSCKKMGLKSSHWSCLKAWFKGYIFCFTTFLVRPSTGAQQSNERAPKKRSNDIERSKFCQQVQSFVCVHPWRRVTFRFWERLKNASEVTGVPKKYFFPKNVELCVKFRGVQSKPGWRYLKKLRILPGKIQSFHEVRS